MIQRIFLIITLVSSVICCRRVQEIPNDETVLFEDYKLGIPLIESSLSIEDMVQNYGSAQDTAEFYMEYDPSCCYQFVYKDSYTYPAAEENIKLPRLIDFADSAPSFTLSVPGGPNPTAALPSTTLTFTFPGGALFGSRLENIYFKNGTLNLKMLKTDAPGNTVNLSLNVTFENLLDSRNVPLQLRINALPNGTERSAEGTPFPLSGYRWNIGTTNPVPVLKITFAITGLSTGSQQPAVTTLSITSVNITDPQWSLLEGKLSTHTIPIADPVSQQLDFNNIFLNVFSGNAITSNDTTTFRFYFKEPSIKFDIQSTYGMPISLTNRLNAINKFGSSNSALFKDTVTRRVTLGPVRLNAANFPGIDQFSSIRPALGVYEVSKNANQDKLPALQALLQPGPRVLESGFLISTNELETTEKNFIFDKSTIRTDATVRIPVYGYVSLFNLRTTVDYPFKEDDLPSPSIIDFNLTVTSVTFKVYYENFMPLNVVFQGYFLDDRNNIIDSLFNSVVVTSDNIKRSGLVIEGAKIDNNGLPSSAAIPLRPLESVKTSNQYLSIRKNCKKVVLVGNMFSSGFNAGNVTASTHVKIRPQNKLKIKLSMAATSNIKLELK